MQSSVDLAKAFGYMTEGEIKLLQSFTLRLPPHPLAVNVGAGAGTSGLAIAEARPDVTIITVDVSEGGPLGGLEGERNAFTQSGLPAERWPLEILGDSRTVAKTWPSYHFGPANLIFIDDGHLKEEIEGDINLWLPHLVPGGIFCFHDYGSPRWPDVMEAVDSLLMRRFPITGKVDTLIGFTV